MRSSIGRSGRLALAAAMLGLAASSALTLAGDEDDLIDDVSKVPAQKRQRVAVRNVEARIDFWIYGNGNGSDGSPQERLESLLRKKVEEVARTAALSENQKQKLLLAGRGDIQRFVVRVDQFKTRFESGKVDVDEWTRIREETRPLQAAVRGQLFTDDSLFAKTLTTMVTAEQLARYQRIDQDRRLFQHRAGVHMTVLRLSTALGLSDDQWKRLEELLLKETQPAQFFDHPGSAGYFNFVYSQMGGLPENRLKPLFEPWQWRVLQRKIGFRRPAPAMNKAVRVLNLNAK